jgi:Sulfotransferase family
MPATSPPADGAAAARPQVLYVMGSGRSGSTILGVTLGNCEGFFYAGEMDNWLVRAGSSAVGGLERTHFWDAVREGVKGAEDMFGTDAQTYLERSSAALRINKRSLQRELRRRYRPVTEEIYRSISATAGARFVIDTSHFPLRANELRHLDGIDLHVVLLVREPQGVVASFHRDVNSNDRLRRALRIVSTNIDLSLTYLLSALVFLRLPRSRRLLLHHEDYLADPEGALRAILDFVGSTAPLPDLDSLDTGFPLQGNRLIRTQTTAHEGVKRGPAKSSRLTAVVQAPWTALFRRLRPAFTVTPREGHGAAAGPDHERQATS